jgi:predicted O-methyltransferase YrrM
MTSLEVPSVRTVLQHLYAQAEKIDGEVFPRVLAAAKELGGPLNDQKVSHLLDEAFMPVSPEVGRLLYILVRTRRPKIAVEFGTSFGLSATHIAAALRDNGEGRLIATELNAAKATRASEHLKDAGLADLVEVRQGDAFETLSDVAGIDFVLLDGWKGLYLPLLKKLEPVLEPGCLIVADDLKIMPELLQPYVDYVRDPQNGYTSSELPLDDGLELSFRNG